MKEIELTQGQVAIVDNKWYEYLNQWLWRVKLSKSAQTFYAVRTVGKRPYCQELFMHNVIMETPINLYVDHIDHIGWHNWEKNLRLVTKSQQHMNMRKAKNKSSKYKGVSWHKRIQKWQGSIAYNEQHISLGYFTDEIQAALAYDEAARQLFGAFAYLNFP